MPFVKGKSGNPAGRPKGATSRTPLIAAITAVEERRRKGKKKGSNKSLYEVYVETAFKDTAVMMHLMSRLVPSLKSIEASIDTNTSGEIRITWQRPEPRPAGIPDIGENIRLLNPKLSSANTSKDGTSGKSNDD